VDLTFDGCQPPRRRDRRIEGEAHFYSLSMNSEAFGVAM
jgi:hypothetical protein